MGCGSSKSADAKAADPLSLEAAQPKKEVVTLDPKSLAERTKTFHSNIRWAKTDEVEKNLKETPQMLDATDPVNGNSALHIAAQNGHLALVKFFIKKKCDVNKQNAGGQTALHMAYSYDLVEVIAALKAAGADGTLLNEEGHPAMHGLSGEKDPQCVEYKMNMLRTAKSTRTLLAAMDGLVSAADRADKAAVVQMALKAKREHKSEWTPEVQAKLGELMTALG